LAQPTGAGLVAAGQPPGKSLNPAIPKS